MGRNTYYNTRFDSPYTLMDSSRSTGISLALLKAFSHIQIRMSLHHRHQYTRNKLRDSDSDTVSPDSRPLKKTL